MRTIYFHAGGAKTGSSALQNFFETNKDALASKGVAYLNGPEIKSHFDIISGNGILLVNSVRYQVHESELKRVILSYFDDKVPNALCSSEALELFDGEDWRHVIDCCSELNIACRIIFFVRDVVPYVYSSYNQFVKRHGEKRSMEQFLTDARWGHVDVLRTLSGAVSPELLNVLHYDTLQNQLIDAFLGSIGIHDDAVFVAAKDVRVNRSLDSEELQTLKEVNGVLGSKYSAEMSDWLITHRPFSNAKVTYELHIVKQIEERFAADVAWVNNGFFGGAEQVKVVPESVRARISIRPSGVAERDDSSAYVLLQWAVKKIATMHNSFYVSMVSRMWDLVMERGYENHPDIPADFNPVTYLFLNPDLLEANALPFSHYVDHGKSEGRKYRLQPAVDDDDEADATQALMPVKESAVMRVASPTPDKAHVAVSAVRRRGGLVIGQNVRVPGKDLGGNVRPDTPISFVISRLQSAVPAELCGLLPAGSELVWRDEADFLAAAAVQAQQAEYGATRWVWLYDEPWAVVAGLQREQIAPALAAWLKIQQEILKLRRLLGKQLVLINASRLQDGAGPGEEPGLAELVFTWAAPHFWDVLEALESAAWLPTGRQPHFRKHGFVPTSGQSLLDLLGGLSDANQLPQVRDSLEQSAHALACAQSEAADLARQVTQCQELYQQTLAQSDHVSEQYQRALEQLEVEQGRLAQLAEERENERSGLMADLAEQAGQVERYCAAAIAEKAALHMQEQLLQEKAAHAEAIDAQLREALLFQQQYAEAVQACGADLADVRSHAHALQTQLEQEQYAHFVLQEQLDAERAATQLMQEELMASEKSMQRLLEQREHDMTALRAEQESYVSRLHKLQEKLEQQMLVNQHLEAMMHRSTVLMHRTRKVVSALAAERNARVVS